MISRNLAFVVVISLLLLLPFKSAISTVDDSAKSLCEDFIAKLIRKDNSAVLALSDGDASSRADIEIALRDFASFNLPPDVNVSVLMDPAKELDASGIVVLTWKATANGKTGNSTYGMDITLKRAGEKWQVASCKAVLGLLTKKIQNTGSTPERDGIIKRYAPLLTGRQVNELRVAAEQLFGDGAFAAAYSSADASVAVATVLATKYSVEYHNKLIAPALFIRGKTNEALGKLLESQQDYKASIPAFVRAGDRLGLTNASIAISELMLRVGMVDVAESITASLIAPGYQLTDDALLAKAQNLNGRAKHALGRDEEALEVLSLSIATATRAKRADLQADATMQAGVTLTSMKSFARALTALQDARKMYEDNKSEIGLMNVDCEFGISIMRQENMTMLWFSRAGL